MSQVHKLHPDGFSTAHSGQSRGFVYVSVCPKLHQSPLSHFQSSFGRVPASAETPRTLACQTGWECPQWFYPSEGNKHPALASDSRIQMLFVFGAIVHGGFALEQASGTPWDLQASKHKIMPMGHGGTITQGRDVPFLHTLINADRYLNSKRNYVCLHIYIFSPGSQPH